MKFCSVVKKEHSTKALAYTECLNLPSRAVYCRSDISTGSWAQKNLCEENFPGKCLF